MLDWNGDAFARRLVDLELQLTVRSAAEHAVQTDSFKNVTSPALAI